MQHPHALTAGNRISIETRAKASISKSEICHETEYHVALRALPIDARQRYYLVKARYVRPVTRSFEYRDIK